MKFSAPFLCRIGGVCVFGHFGTENIPNSNVTWRCSWCVSYLCVVHGQDCTGVSSYGYECSSQRKVSGVYCVLLTDLRHGLSLNQELAILARVDDKRAFQIYLPPQPHSAGVVGTRHAQTCPTFMWLFGIRTHVLMFAKQVLLLTESSPKPQLSFRISVNRGKHIHLRYAHFSPTC